MNAERFRQIKEIFGAALDLPIEKRRSFVAEKCGDDEELLVEINAILDSHDEAEDFIENPAFDSLNNFVLNERDLKLSGKQIGAYRVVRELGHGGMGAVYLCERTEGFRKQVAVKLIKRGLDTNDIIRRFERERQILAALDHPNIARLIDGGTTDDGLPYLVMDYVEGIPVTEYCAENDLSTEEILKLFQEISAAVAYAHQNLIVHRDVKPTNILVTKEGTPKLLDFGIAKLLAASESEPLTEITQTRQAMTPEYASPEQLEGERVTTATDTFSLGVVLYELLTGARPSSVSSRPSLEKVSANSAKQRTKDAAQKTKFPKGDLGKILAMSLRKEPERRYSSVDQFAADIKRFLAGLPVIAQADSFSYRAEKFVRRNKAPVAAGVGVLFSLVGAVIATSRQSRRAQRQRDKAEKVSEFLQKTLAAPDSRVAGKDVKFVEVLANVAQTIDADFADQPAIAADLHTTVGMTYLSLGIFDLSEKHLKNALDVRLAIFSRKSLEVASSLTNYGKVLHEKGDLITAEPFLTEACAILNRKPFDKTLAFADVLRNLAYLHAYQSNHEEALRLQFRELEIRREIQGENQKEVARTLDELGEKMRLSGEISKAESLHRRSIEILRQIYGDEHPDIALAMIKLSYAIYAEKPSEAEDLCRRALAISRRLLGEEHAETAWAAYMLANVLISRQKYREADEYLQTILSKQGASFPESHMVVGSSYVLFGRSLVEQKRYAEAKSVLEKGLALRRITLPDAHWMIALPSVFLGECLMNLGEPETGEKLLLENYEILKNKLGESHELTQTAREKITPFFPAS